MNRSTELCLSGCNEGLFVAEWEACTLISFSVFFKKNLNVWWSEESRGQTYGLVFLCLLVCELTLRQDLIVRCTAVHVGVNRARHSRPTLLPDSFLSSQLEPVQPEILTHSPHKYNMPLNDAVHVSVTPFFHQPQPKHTPTDTHTSLCKLCWQTWLSLAPGMSHMLMYSATHSNWRSSALKYSPISLWPANGSNPVSYSSFYFVFKCHATKCPPKRRQPHNTAEFFEAQNGFIISTAETDGPVRFI